MAYCECSICRTDEEPITLTKAKFFVSVKKLQNRYWAVRSGSTWVEIRGSCDMSLDDVRKKVFTELEDVRAHPSSVHYDE